MGGSGLDVDVDVGPDVIEEGVVASVRASLGRTSMSLTRARKRAMISSKTSTPSSSPFTSSLSRALTSCFSLPACADKIVGRPLVGYVGGMRSVNVFARVVVVVLVSMSGGEALKVSSERTRE